MKLIAMLAAVYGLDQTDSSCGNIVAGFSDSVGTFENLSYFFL